MAIGPTAFLFKETCSPAPIVFVLVLCSTSVCCSALSKMVRPMDQSGKRKANPPPTLPPSSWMLLHCGNTGERRSKVRKDVRQVPPSKSMELKTRGSPLEKRSREIHVSTSEEEAAKECERSPGTSDCSQSWRCVTVSPPN